MRRGRALRPVVNKVKSLVIGGIDSILRPSRNVLLNTSFEVINVIPYLSVRGYDPTYLAL
jgi:hypothetical protein